MKNSWLYKWGIRKKKESEKTNQKKRKRTHCALLFGRVKNFWISYGCIQFNWMDNKIIITKNVTRKFSLSISFYIYGRTFIAQSCYTQTFISQLIGSLLFSYWMCRWSYNFSLHSQNYTTISIGICYCKMLNVTNICRRHPFNKTLTLYTWTQHWTFFVSLVNHRFSKGPRIIRQGFYIHSQLTYIFCMNSYVKYTLRMSFIIV